MTCFLQGKRRAREVDDSIIHDVEESQIGFNNERATKDLKITIPAREEDMKKEQHELDQRNRMFQEYFPTRKEIQLKHIGRPSVITSGRRERVDIAFINKEMLKLQESMTNQKGNLNEKQPNSISTHSRKFIELS